LTAVIFKFADCAVVSGPVQETAKPEPGLSIIIHNICSLYRSKIYERMHKKINIIPVQVVKTYKWIRGIAPLILNLDTGLKVSGQLHAPTALPPGGRVDIAR
jgi:hypothetical protein